MNLDSHALLTDLYQLSMAYCYWKEGIAQRKASFYLFFRKKPFGGEFAMAAGLATLIEFIETFHFSESDLSYLSSLKGYDDKPLFDQGFIRFLQDFRFSLDIDAVEEGTIVFPQEPIIRVTGPILHAQLLESPLLNILNFQTLIATKAARICLAAGEDEIIEFGMRRAQGFDGALTASRAAFIGGCQSSSNVIAGKMFNIPVKGTQAHSWVLCFDDEKKAFDVFGRHMPGNSVFLIDTYHSIEGAKHAVEIALKMKKEGKRVLGVRLDSGDLAHLSKKVRKILDEAGLQDMKIMASNELDEHIIYDLKNQGAQIDIWGVGTALVTGKGQAALDGVYKLAMVEDENGNFQPRMKISDQIFKSTTPGLLTVRRFYQDTIPYADMIYDLNLQHPLAEEIISTQDSSSSKSIPKDLEYRDLHLPIYRKGKLVYSIPSLIDSQKKGKEELKGFEPEMKRFLFPTPYFIGLEKHLFEEKVAMMRHRK